jgi:phage terminase large subunit-like protein
MSAAVRPFPKQEQFLATPADFALFGGAAGGGKTWALLMETIRHIKNPQFGAVIFRRTHKEITAEGGLWDKAEELYPLLQATPLGNREWLFPSGSKITFSHMQHEKDKRSWDSSQIPLICFDELHSFSETQFWYMFSRNRSTCGIRPYMRATCNPDADSWVAELIAWWIDQDTGYPIQERSGVIRWCIREGGNLIWGDSKHELTEAHAGARPISMTFVPSKLDDNPELDKKDPEYRAKLMMLEHVERERLLGGNWKVRPVAGILFPRDKWKLVDAAPEGLRLLRFWDKAYTEGGKGARTAGVLVGQLPAEKARELHLPPFFIVHGEAGRWGEAEREGKIRSAAELDRAERGYVRIGIEQEGGAGKQASLVTAQNLQGFDVYIEHPTAKKHIRWRPLAAQQQVGNVAIVRGNWDWADFIRELDALAGDEVLDKAKLRDYADAAAGAFKGLTGGGHVHGELIASGDPDHDDRTPLTKEELAEAPDFLKELLGTYREDDREPDYDPDERPRYGGRR